MALVSIHSPRLTADQKKRIGDRVLQALHAEGLPASTTIILFKREEADILLEGGLLIEADEAPAPTPEPPSVPAAPVEEYASPETRLRTRRSPGQLRDLREQVIASLQHHGHLSSFEAQEALGLKDSEGAPAALRRIFNQLEEDGLIAKQGQKRGTRYVWNGYTRGQAPPPAILVKRETDHDDEDGFAV